MIITKLSAENFQDVSCGSFWAVAFLLPNTKDKRDGRTGYLRDSITGIHSLTKMSSFPILEEMEFLRTEFLK